MPVKFKERLENFARKVGPAYALKAAAVVGRRGCCCEDGCQRRM